MTDREARSYTRRDLAALLLAGVASFAAFPAGARAALGPAENYVSNIADDVMSLANSGQQGKKLRGRFASLLARYVNLRQIANFALGPYQSKLPGSRRDEFYDLVSTYAAALFVYYVEDFRGTELEITSVTQQGKYTTVMSAIKRKGGGREQVRWRLVPAGSSFRVYDVNVKGVWLTIAMKKRFGDVLNKSKGDFGPLFDELREAETW